VANTVHQVASNAGTVCLIMKKENEAAMRTVKDIAGKVHIPRAARLSSG
jgi:hypothetical protein